MNSNPSSIPSSRPPIIIVGAGLLGLVLAQALQLRGIPYEIYERDVSLAASVAGWAITVHWCLPELERLLPKHLFDRLPTAQVDPEQAAKDDGRFAFYDLSTATPKFLTPPTPRLRLNRRNFRALLAEDIPVRWGKTFISFATDESKSIVTVCFADGTSTTGSVLLGVDGASSRIRRSLLGPELGALQSLPIVLMGVTLHLNPTQAQPILSLDPILFHGCHPVTHRYLWCSILSTPEYNKSSHTDNPYYAVQLIISWLLDPEPQSTSISNPIGGEDEDKIYSGEPPEDNASRVALLKSSASWFAPPLRDTFNLIPDDSSVNVIRLADWPTPTQGWSDRPDEGLVTLVGDAAHAMCMYRGEGFGHGTVDCVDLMDSVEKWWSGSIKDGDQQVWNYERKQAIQRYEERMRPRANRAVLRSREAAFSAHDWDSLSDESECIKARVRDG